MADFLSKDDWQRELKKHKSVKRTGISDKLGDIVSANKKNDPSKKMLAYAALLKQISSVKSNKKYQGNDALFDYLDKMEKAAIAARNSAQVGEEDVGDNAKDPPLKKDLRRVQKLGPKSAWQFCAAPGKPSSGLVLSKKKIMPEQRKEAMALRGKKGPTFIGLCYGESGKWVFELEDKPPAGLAKAIKLAARIHANMGIKVLVRGGGVEVDDEQDKDVDYADALGEEGPQSSVTSYPTQEQWIARLESISKAKPEMRDDLAAGIRGQARQYLAALAKDTVLSPDQKEQMQKMLNTVVATTQNSSAFAEQPVRPGRGGQRQQSGYRSLEDWKQIIQKVAQVDQAKRQQARNLIVEQLKAVKIKLDADRNLTPGERRGEMAILQEATKLLLDLKADQEKAMTTAQTLPLGDRVKRSVAEYQRAVRNPLPPAVAAELQKRYNALLQAVKAKNERAIIAAMISLEELTKQAAEMGGKAAVNEQRAKAQKEQFANIKPSIDLAERAALPNGTARALVARKDELKIDKPLAGMIKLIDHCERDHSPKALKALCDQSKIGLQHIAVQREKANGKEKTLQVLAAQEKVYKDALQRGRLLEIVGDFNRLGPPPYDKETEERATELQMAIMFEEAAITGGAAGPSPQLAALGGDDVAGVNGAFWVAQREMVRPPKRDPDDTSPPAPAKFKDAKQYIFKPAMLESDSFMGIAPGASAPREVLAKTMSDELASHGFNINVCPTVLTSVDTSKLVLEDNSPARGVDRVMGATQALAKHNGPFEDLVKSDEDLGKKIDPKNYGELVVFDLMFMNVDRHSNNLLLGDEDPDTGKVPLIPIDHGLGLLEPDAAYGLAGRLISQNTLMKDKIPQKDALLDPEVRANLKSLDGMAMIKSMAEAREGMAKRHPETNGLVSDDALRMMERRTAFLQYACDHLTAEQLTLACALYLREIVEAKTPADHHKIVETMKDRAPKLAKANQDLARWKEAEQEAGEGGSFGGVLHPLEKGGWCLSMLGLQDDRDQWLAKNPDLVARIRATNLDNPAARAEIRERLALSGDPQLAKKLEGMSVGDQLTEVRRSAPLAWETEPEGLDDDEMQKRFEALGGETALKAATRVFDAPGDRMADKLHFLIIWKEFNDQGGMQEYHRLAGISTRSLQQACGRLVEARREEQAIKNLMDMPPEDVIANQRITLSDLMQEVGTLLPKIKDATKRAKFQNEVQELDAMIKQGKLDEAQPKLSYIPKRIEKWIYDEGHEEKAARKLLTQFETDLAQAAEDKAIQAPMETELRKKLQAAKARLDKFDVEGLTVSSRSLAGELDVALKGDESVVRKAGERLRTVKALMNGAAKGGLSTAALTSMTIAVSTAEKEIVSHNYEVGYEFLRNPLLLLESVRDLPGLRQRAGQTGDRMEALMKTVGLAESAVKDGAFGDLQKYMGELRQALAN